MSQYSTKYITFRLDSNAPAIKAILSSRKISKAFCRYLCPYSQKRLANETEYHRLRDNNMKDTSGIGDV